MSRVVLLALMAIGLAGCVTTAAHTLDVDDVRALRLERVDLVLDPAAKIYWIRAQDEYAEALNRRGDAQATGRNVLETDGFRTYATAQLQPKVREIVEPALRSALAGTKPVVARVTVHHIHIPGFMEGAIKSVTLGPASVESGMSVSIDFIEAKTGRPIVTYPRTGLLTQGANRISLGMTGAFSADPIERMLSDLAQRVPAWLLKT